ncbi:Importin subunit alpha-1 [Cardamine amara subsp. amara]|uniref:Importin subunit alpha-1 n=1 Tax=Cardamine amara subsp. amara TaxID=228776 RepID=A0ABD0Z8N6_CARAN
MEDISDMVAGVLSEEPLLQLEATTKFRKFLSSNVTSNVDEVIESGTVPRFVEFLKKEDSPKLQYEAAWIITNIAAVNLDVVIDHGAVPILVQLLASPNDDVLEQAMWALSNVAGSSTENRDFVLKSEALITLCSHLNKDTTKMSTLEVGTWTLLNFCRGMPRPLFDQVKPALPALKRLLQSDDEELLSDACSALWYMSYGSDEGIQCVIEDGFVPRLVQLFHHTSPFVIDPVRGIICAILSIDKQQIQCVIDGGALAILANLLTQDCDKSIKMEACWMITNITVGTEEQIQSVIDANLIPILVNLAQTAEMNIKTKAIWAISFAISGGSDAQVKYLVKENCIKPLCDLLVCPDLMAISVCLDGLECLLIIGEAKKKRGEVNCYAKMIKDAKGLEKIQNLKSHDHTPIKDKAVMIREKYWPLKKR